MSGGASALYICREDPCSGSFKKNGVWFTQKTRLAQSLSLARARPVLRRLACQRGRALDGGESVGWPVLEDGAADDVLLREKAPQVAVERLVAVVAEDEDALGRHLSCRRVCGFECSRRVGAQKRGGVRVRDRVVVVVVVVVVVRESADEASLLFSDLAPEGSIFAKIEKVEARLSWAARGDGAEVVEGACDPATVSIRVSRSRFVTSVRFVESPSRHVSYRECSTDPAKLRSLIMPSSSCATPLMKRMPSSIRTSSPAT